MLTVTVGQHQQTDGTISLEDEHSDFQFTGNVAMLQHFMERFRKMPLNRGLSNSDLLRRVPQAMNNGYSWADLEDNTDDK